MIRRFLQGKSGIVFGLVDPGASPFLLCRLSEHKCLRLPWLVLQELNISPLFPVWTTCKLYSGLQKDLGQAGFCDSRLCYLHCSVSVLMTDYIRQREARAGSCFLFLTHTSLQDFIILQTNRRDLWRQQQNSLCPAHHDLKEVSGHKWKRTMPSNYCCIP